MKKLIVIGMVAVLAMAMATAASAEANWIAYLHGGTATNGNASADPTFGQMTASTGYTTPGTPSATNCLVALSWTAREDGAYLNKDYRLTGLPSPLEYQVFLINGATYPDAKIYLKFWAPSAAFQQDDKWYLTNETKTVIYWEGMTPVAANMGAAPVIASFDATTTGTRLWLTTVVVPEPGSIVALASGLVGLVGFGIRRRK